MDKLRQFEVIGCGAPQMDRLVRRLHEEKIPDRLPPRRSDLFPCRGPRPASTAI